MKIISADGWEITNGSNQGKMIGFSYSCPYCESSGWGEIFRMQEDTEEEFMADFQCTRCGKLLTIRFSR